jgi:hypothetical protein
MTLLYGFRDCPASAQAAGRKSSICLSHPAIWFQLAGIGGATACEACASSGIMPASNGLMLPYPLEQYPPDKREQATQTVLELAEVRSELWAAQI